MRKTADHFLDITADVCPMTFVRTKLLLERMTPGQTAEIRLNSGEPLDNVPRSAAELGHAVLEIRPESAAEPVGVHRLLIQRR